MSISVVDADALATDVDFETDAMRAILADGREIIVPLEWLPCLREATARQSRRAGTGLPQVSRRSAATVGWGPKMRKLRWSA